MKHILVTYATMAGSTAEVAQAVAGELQTRGIKVDVLPLDGVRALNAYDGVVLGAPMILGWHRGALRFLKKQRAALQHKPLALFVTAMSLTKTEATQDSSTPLLVSGVPVTVDERLPKAPANLLRLSFRERYARLSNYVRPILRACGAAKPASIGIFGGRMEYGRLKWWAVLFAMFIVRAPAGDRRNWDAIRAWANALPAAMALDSAASEPAAASRLSTVGS